MLLFDQLRISDNGQRLYINMHVNEADFFENIYLDSITIATADKVLEAYGAAGTDPTITAVDYIYKKTFSGNEKSAALVLTKASFDEAYTKISDTRATMSFDKSDLSDTLFFVYVKCKLADGETIDACIPCTLDEEVTLGVTFDTTALYQRVMGYTRELADDCNIPANFIDFILNFNAFKAAVETEHYIPAINFYNQMFNLTGTKNNMGPAVRSSCGCR